MYEELIGDLRYCDKGDCNGCRRYTKDTRFCNTLLREAADAIEELSNAGSIYGKAWTLGYDAGRDENKPRWIPVTERLPEKCSDVLAYIERNAWGDGDVRYRKREIAIGYHVNGLWHVDGCSRVDCIAWMPLPEPPKEET